jgi:hypothetical protein
VRRSPEVYALAPRAGGNDMVSRRDIAILLIVLISGLCVTLYRAWIDPFQALAALAIVGVTVLGLTVFT